MKPYGIKMPPLKERLFNLVRRSGSEGIPTEMIANILEKKRVTVKVHIHQINKLLIPAGWRIATTRPRYGYFLKKLQTEKDRHGQQPANHSQRRRLHQ